MKRYLCFLSTLLKSTLCLSLQVGDIAPNFNLMGTDSQFHQLADYRGQPVILAWFPKAMTPGCSKELSSLTSLHKKIKLKLFMISTDSHEKNTEFSAKHDSAITLLSDPSKKTARDYHVLYPIISIPKRWTFYIDPAGKIVKIDKHVNPSTAASDMLKTIKELKWN